MVKLFHISCSCYNFFHHESVSAFVTFGNLWSNLEFWEFSTCQFEIYGLCTIVFFDRYNLKSQESWVCRFEVYALYFGIGGFYLCITFMCNVFGKSGLCFCVTFMCQKGLITSFMASLLWRPTLTLHIQGCLSI
jgi:hypothetical protein